MDVRIESVTWQQVDADFLAVLVPETAEWPTPLAAFDEALGGTLTRIRQRGDLTGRAGEICQLPDINANAGRLVLVGSGPPEKLDQAGFERAVAIAMRQITSRENVRAAVAWTENENLSAADAVRTATTAAVVAGAGQGVYQTEPGRHPLAGLTVLAEPTPEIQSAAETGRILGECINLTRDLVNRSANEIYPEVVAQRAEELAHELGLNCDILDENRLAAEKMGALLAVAQGSDRPPRVVVLEYRGGGDAPPLALVGKGVCFDSGGLSIKPTESMNSMKADMAGAATVLGALAAIARLKLPVNVVGYLGLVENMISGSSYKLGDVLTARNGVTIEVLNTDAEGRLVLADVLHYAAERGAGRIVDLATLTGACVVALGEDVTGVFTNDQNWCDAVLAAARRSGESVWQLPMFDQYSELLKSDVADCKNIGGRWGGAITAAKFLEKFVDGKPWIHLDIAGPSFANSTQSHREGGATGAMLRTLVTLATGQ